MPNELPLAQLDTLLAQFRPSPTSSESPPRTASLFSSPGASFSCIFNPESLLTRKLHGFTASSALWCRKAISLLPCSTHHPAALSHDIAAYFQIDISKNRRSTGFERTFEICSPGPSPFFFARHSCACSTHASLPACIRAHIQKQGVAIDQVAMLLTFSHYAQVQQPQYQADMEAGDFDHTPAPSARSSFTMLRPEESHKTADISEISVSKAAAVFRHHLLKTSASGPTLVARDLPAPPVVSRSPPIKTLSQPPKPELENQGAVPSRPASALPRPNSLVHRQDKMLSSSPIRLIDREHVNAIPLPNYDAHADTHHPGLLEGADFCDYGIRSAGFRSLISSTEPSSPVSDISMMSGEMHRVLSSGDISVTEVTVPIHRHKGHSIAVKVRPAFFYHPSYHSANLGGQHGLNYSRSANKVQPFESGLDHSTLAVESTRDGIKKEAKETPGIMFPSSKIRPFLHELDTEDDHQYHSHELKVRPYTRTDGDEISLHHQFPPVNVGSEHVAIRSNGQHPSHSDLEEILPKRIMGEFETALSRSYKSPQIENETKNSYQGRRYTPSDHLIHSPIPVSKIRPIFTIQPSSSGHESHSSASKAGPIQQDPNATATQDQSHFRIRSGQSLHS